MRGRQCVHSPRRATVPSALPNCMAVVGVRENVVASRVVMGGEKAAPHASSATRRKRESSIADEIGFSKERDSCGFIFRALFSSHGSYCLRKGHTSNTLHAVATGPVTWHLVSSHDQVEHNMSCVSCRMRPRRSRLYEIGAHRHTHTAESPESSPLSRGHHRG